VIDITAYPKEQSELSDQAALSIAFHLLDVLHLAPAPRTTAVMVRTVMRALYDQHEFTPCADMGVAEFIGTVIGPFRALCIAAKHLPLCTAVAEEMVTIGAFEPFPLSGES
jgi:hypothetical protein